MRERNIFKVVEEAIENNDIGVMRKLLDQGMDINIKNEKDETPLFLAVERVNLEMVQLLLSRGVDVNAKALPRLISLGRIEVASRLNLEGQVAHGLNAYITKANQRDVLSILAKRHIYTEAKAYATPKIMELLLQYGADVDYAAENASTLLIQLIQTNNFHYKSRAELLIQAGATFPSEESITAGEENLLFTSLQNFKKNYYAQINGIIPEVNDQKIQAILKGWSNLSLDATWREVESQVTQVLKTKIKEGKEIETPRDELTAKKLLVFRRLVYSCAPEMMQEFLPWLYKFNEHAFKKLEPWLKEIQNLERMPIQDQDLKFWVSKFTSLISFFPAEIQNQVMESLYESCLPPAVQKTRAIDMKCLPIGSISFQMVQQVHAIKASSRTPMVLREYTPAEFYGVNLSR